MIDVVNNITTIILSTLLAIGILIGFVAWFIRLESKVQYLEKDHNEHKGVIKIELQTRERAVWEKFETIQSGMNEVLRVLGKIEGRLQGHDAHS